MAKKIALLLSLVMMFSISCVFATEAEDTTTTETVVSGEVLEVVTEGSGEEVVDTETVSGEVSGETEEPTTTPSENVSGEVSGDETDAEETESGNGTVLAAVIAIVIVVAIVAIVSVLKKK